MWKIEYSKEVRNYLYDSYPYTETIWQTIKALRQIADGVPPPGSNYRMVTPDRFMWLVANHTVIVVRLTAESVLYVETVKPDADEEYVF